jgi:hypothetical protein
MKKELIWIAIGIYWLLLLGVLAPWLISAPSDIAVFLGFGLIGASAYATYRFILTQQKAT